MPSIETALRELRTILTADCAAPDWRWNVRLRLSEVKESLTDPRAHQPDPQARQPEAWLAARSQLSDRERFQLQARVSTLATSVLDKLDTSTVVHEMQRLLGDLEHHVQRRHDLVYDSVSLELGGSE